MAFSILCYILNISITTALAKSNLPPSLNAWSPSASTYPPSYPKSTKSIHVDIDHPRFLEVLSEYLDDHYHVQAKQASELRRNPGKHYGSQAPQEDARRLWKMQDKENNGKDTVFIQLGEQRYGGGFGDYNGRGLRGEEDESEYDQDDRKQNKQEVVQQAMMLRLQSLTSMLQNLQNFFKVPVSWLADNRYKSQRYRSMTGVEEAKLLHFMIKHQLANDNRIVEPMTDFSPIATSVFGRGFDYKKGVMNLSPAGNVTSQHQMTSWLLTKMGMTPLNNIEKSYGCHKVKYEYLETCRAYANYLHNCPAMQTQLCHIDQGGKEILLSPCPVALIGYYCVRFNPTYALAQIAK